MSIIIQSLTEYINKIPTLKNGQEIYFRGQVQGFSRNEYGIGINDFQNIHGELRCNIEPQPTILRKNRAKREKDYLYKATEMFPHEFEGLNIVDKLAKMQHYGWPTRLIDFTTKPLVALYFACQKDTESDNKNGIVYYHITNKKDETKNYELEAYEDKLETIRYESDRAYLLASFARINREEQDILREFCEALNELRDLRNKPFNEKYKLPKETLHQFDDYNINGFTMSYLDRDYNNIWVESISKNPTSNKNFYGSNGANLQFDFYDNTEKIKNIIENNKEKYKKLNEIIEAKKKHEKIKTIRDSCLKFFGEVEKERISFQNFNTIPDDLLNSFILLPSSHKSKNERLKNQGGVFCIVGLDNQCVLCEKIYIDAKSKQNILQELDKLGINQVSIFDDLENGAKYIKEKWDSIN